VFSLNIGGVESILGPLGTAAIYWPIVPAPGDCEDGEVGGMNCGWQGKPKYSRENLPRHHFVHHKSHLPDPGANLGRRGRKPATNRFSYQVS
jgi:hypothetical protein